MPPFCPRRRLERPAGERRGSDARSQWCRADQCCSPRRWLDRSSVEDLAGVVIAAGDVQAVRKRVLTRRTELAPDDVVVEVGAVASRPEAVGRLSKRRI